MNGQIRVLHLLHSLDPRTGGVLSAARLLNQALLDAGADSSLTDNPSQAPLSNQDWIIAHGLWQWPAAKARHLHLSQGNPYLVFPHGMLDPWFKKTYPFKHLKKQAYWWFKMGSILGKAKAVCFTTEEEKRLAQKTFFPYRCEEKVVGLGVSKPPGSSPVARKEFLARFPDFKDRKILFYLGRFHPKKGVDELIRAWKNRSPRGGEALALAGPLEANHRHLEKLRQLAGEDPSIYWTGMLEGAEKWEALRLADGLVLPSHQENYGMVVAEACSVGLPVYLTDKVNLWREVVEAGAGEARSDSPQGIQELVNLWLDQDQSTRSTAALRCFENRLQVEAAAERLLQIIMEEAP